MSGRMASKIDIEALCNDRGLRITDQRRVIARVISDATDHPDVEELYRRSSAIDPKFRLPPYTALCVFSKRQGYWTATISALAAPVMKHRPKRITTI